MKYSGISFPSDFPQALIDNIRIQEEDQVLLKKYPLDYKGNDNYQNDQSHKAFANYMKSGSGNGNGNDNYANSTIKQKSPLNCETNENQSDRKRNNLNNVIGRSQTNLRANFSNNLPYSHQKNSAEGSINSNSINSDSLGYNNNRDRTVGYGPNRKNSVISNFNNSKPILRARNTLSRASMKLKSFTALTDRRRSRAVLYNLNILSGKNENRNKNNLAKTWRSGINGGSNFQKQIPEYKMATMEHSVKYIIFHYSNIKILWDMLIMIATLYWWGLGVWEMDLKNERR